MSIVPLIILIFVVTNSSTLYFGFPVKVHQVTIYIPLFSQLFIIV